MQQRIIIYKPYLFEWKSPPNKSHSWLEAAITEIFILITIANHISLNLGREFTAGKFTSRGLYSKKYGMLYLSRWILRQISWIRHFFPPFPLHSIDGVIRFIRLDLYRNSVQNRGVTAVALAIIQHELAIAIVSDKLRRYRTFSIAKWTKECKTS